MRILLLGIFVLGCLLGPRSGEATSEPRYETNGLAVVASYGYASASGVGGDLVFYLNELPVSWLGLAFYVGGGYYLPIRPDHDGARDFGQAGASGGLLILLGSDNHRIALDGGVGLIGTEARGISMGIVYGINLGVGYEFLSDSGLILRALGGISVTGFPAHLPLLGPVAPTLNIAVGYKFW